MIFRLCRLWEGWEVAKASVKTTDLFNSTDQRVLLEFFRNFGVALFAEKQAMQYDVFNRFKSFKFEKLEKKNPSIYPKIGSTCTSRLEAC